MKEFGIIHARFWEWAEENGLSAHAKLIAAYLLTCRHANSIGCFRIPKEYLSVELGYGMDTVSDGFRELTDTHFMLYCDRSRHVFIRNYLRWNPPQNEKHAKGILKQAAQLPSSLTISDKVLESLVFYLSPKIDRNRIETVCHTLSKPYRYTNTNTNTDTNTDTDTNTKEAERCQEHPSDPVSEPSLPPESDSTQEQTTEPEPDPTVFEVPLSRKNETFAVTESLIWDWQQDFPAVNVRAELQKLVRWNKDNPTRRKTRNGIKRHISSWLGRAQDRAASQPQPSNGNGNGEQQTTSGGWPIGEDGMPMTWDQIRNKRNREALQRAGEDIMNGGGLI